MVQAIQKAHEQRIFAQFLATEGLSHTPFQSVDSPDIDCEIKGQSVCFELVDYFNQDGAGGNSPKLQEQLQQRLMHQAQQQYFAQEGHRPWHVVAMFEEPGNLRDRDLPPLIAQLVQLLKDAPCMPERQDVHFSQADLPVNLRPHIRHLRYELPPEDGFCLWQPSRSGWVGEIDAARVMAILGKKEKKLPKYRARSPAAAQILLVHVNLFAVSSHASLEWRHALPLSTPFDGVVAFTPFGSSGKTLWLKRCAAFDQAQN